MDERMEADDQSEHEEDGATKAFGELRAEVASMRKAVELMPAALGALEPPDYTPSFGAISKVLSEVDKRLRVIEHHPALRLTPEQHGREIIQAGAETAREMSRVLREEADFLRRERQYLADIVGGARTREAQKRTCLWMLGGGIVGGLILFPLLGSFAPGGSYLAAWATGNLDRWQAGFELMQASNPTGAQMLATASQLVNANADVLRTCTDAARKAGRDQKCTVEVPVP